MTNFNRVIRTIADISRQLRIPWSTVKFTLWYFHERGNSLESFNKRPSRFDFIP